MPMPIPTTDPIANRKIANINLGTDLLTPANSSPKQKPTTNLCDATAPVNNSTLKKKYIFFIISHAYTKFFGKSDDKIEIVISRNASYTNICFINIYCFVNIIQKIYYKNNTYIPSSLSLSLSLSLSFSLIKLHI